MKSTFALFLYVMCILSFGCTGTPSPSERVLQVTKTLEMQKWRGLLIKTGAFDLQSFFPDPFRNSERIKGVEDVLTVYIEGDGFAWETRYRPSHDPTPINPVGLQLALEHPAGAVAYLARPCQFVGVTHPGECAQRYWTHERFSPVVIAATNEALTILKNRFDTRYLRLVGFSGGGAIAALVAAQREDVVQLITVAGNMDHETWATRNNINPLKGSLNPSDEWRRLVQIPQVHLIGGQDEIINEEVLDSYLEKFPEGKRPEKIVFPNNSHSCGWQEQWRDIYPRLIN